MMAGRRVVLDLRLWQEEEEKVYHHHHLLLVAASYFPSSRPGVTKKLC